jgi:hypothetical protein
MKNKQPAELSYFFYGGFVDLAQVISGTFTECGIIIGKSKEGLVEVWFGFDEIPAIIRFIVKLSVSSFHLFKLIFCSIVTPLICLLISMFQITTLLAWFLTASILFFVIIISDRIFCTINAIANHCPVCQTHFTMPVYICPKCTVEHTKLRPGIYGILYRKCNCGEKLPTTFFNGRQKLQALCPDCKSNIKGGGLQASWCIPVVGGPSAGKTCYINMTMMSLEKNSESMYGLSFVYENNGLDEYEENCNRLSRGYLPEKTTDHRLRYYQFSLTPKKATKQLISLCDVAGELFDIKTGGNEIVKQIGFRYANSFILLIDPLSISAYRNEVSKAVNLDEYKGSVQHLDEMLDTFIGTLQNMFSIKASSMLNTSVAVVFTKADIPGLDIKIGKNAVLKNAARNDKKTIYQTQNQLCEQFLREYNEDGFLNNLKSRFKSIQFFTCSALGHIENGKPFVASNVDEPFFWLVKIQSKVIRNVLK